MFKKILKIRDKYPFKTRLIFWLILLFLSSAMLNVSFIYDNLNKDQKIIKSIKLPISKVKTITGVKTNIVTKKDIELNNIIKIEKNKEKTSSENLKILENSELKIKIDRFKIVEDNKNKMHFPKTIKGEANLSYLYWDIEVELITDIEYRKNPLDLRIMAGAYGYISPNGYLKIDTNYFIQHRFLYPFNLNLPIIGDSISLGIGIPGISFTRPIDVFGNLKLDIGGLYLFNSSPALIIGFSVKL